MRTSLRAIATKAREQKDLRFCNLYRLIDENFLLECWRDIRKNAACGVDGISARQYEENLMDNIGNLVERLKRKNYRARLVRRHWIPKPDGRQRPLGIVDADIQGFFDNLSHSIIMSLWPNGWPTATFVLNFLDWQLDHAGYRFVRYADDFVVLCPTSSQAKEALALVQQVLEQRLRLRLSPEKTKVTSFAKGYSFLGFVLSSRSCRMRPKSVKKFKDKVRELTCRKHNLDIEQVEKLNRVIRGTARYFVARFVKGRRTFNRLDCWIRMRLRCMKSKAKSRRDHLKLKNNVFDRLGVIRLDSFGLIGHDRKFRYRPPFSGAIPAGSPGA